jgi:hypothetical protein
VVVLVFKISTPKLELEVALEEMGKLRIHEEIIPNLLEGLVAEIKSDGMLRHPVVVSSGDLVVLDGMHRVAALKELSCKFALACLVDYQNPSVKVEAWHRLIRGGSIGEVLEAGKSAGFESEPTELEGAIAPLNRREVSAILLAGDKCYSLKGEGMGIREIHSQIKTLEKSLAGGKMQVTYETKNDALRKAESGEGAALLIPTVRKEEVLEAARSGEVFAHKTTRHVVPARPMGVNVPLDWLTSGSKQLPELNRDLEESLRRKDIERMPSGSLFEGRRYEEELYVFK